MKDFLLLSFFFFLPLFGEIFQPFVFFLPFFSDVSELFALLGYFFGSKGRFCRFYCLCWCFLPLSAEVLWPKLAATLCVRLSISSGCFQGHFWEPFYYFMLVLLFFVSFSGGFRFFIPLFSSPFIFFPFEFFFFPEPPSVLTLRRLILSPFFPLPAAF